MKTFFYTTLIATMLIFNTSSLVAEQPNIIIPKLYCKVINANNFAYDFELAELSKKAHGYNELQYDLLTYAPWSLEEEDAIYLAWCNKNVPSYTWKFPTLVVSDFSVAERTIMEMINIWKIDVFHYTYEYNHETCFFEETHEYYFDEYYVIQDQLDAHAETLYLYVSLYDSNYEMVEATTIVIPIVYEDDNK